MTHHELPFDKLRTNYYIRRFGRSDAHIPLDRLAVVGRALDPPDSPWALVTNETALMHAQIDHMRHGGLSGPSRNGDGRQRR